MKPAVDPIPRIALRTHEAALAVGVSKETMQNWLKLDDFPKTKVGGTVVVLVDKLHNWLATQAGNGEGGRNHDR